MKNWGWKLVWMIPGIIAMFALFVVVGLFLVKLIWAWLIPDLFPGAVKLGLVAAQITWYAAFKVAIFMAVLGAFSGGKRMGHHRDKWQHDKFIKKMGISQEEHDRWHKEHQK